MCECFVCVSFFAPIEEEEEEDVEEEDDDDDDGRISALKEVRERMEY